MQQIFVITALTAIEQVKKCVLALKQKVIFPRKKTNSLLLFAFFHVQKVLIKKIIYGDTEKGRKKANGEC